MINFKSKIIELYDYRKIDLSGIAEPFSMSEAELTAKIDRIRKKHAVQLDGESVQNEDFVTLSCKSDTAKFNKESIVLRVGAGLFSRELEDKIIGLSVNDKKRLLPTMPRLPLKSKKFQGVLCPSLTTRLFANSALRA